MPFDPDQYLQEKQQPFDPDAYLQSRQPKSVLQRATEFGKGEAQGVAGTLAGMTKYLPGDELPFLPEGARAARRAARGDVERFANEPSAGTEQSIGRFVGETIPTAALPELGVGRAIGAGAEMATKYSPTLLHLAGLYHYGIPYFFGHNFLRHLGLVRRLDSLARAAAPYVGRAATQAGRVGEKIGVGQAASRAGAPDDRDSRPAETPRRAPQQPGGETFRPGRGDRFRGDDAATD